MSRRELGHRFEDENIKKEIKIMQEHLPLLRKIAGWSAEELGAKLGLAKQSVLNMESNNKATVLSQVQFLALLAIFDMEACENDKLALALNMLFEDVEKYEVHKESIDTFISLAANDKKIKTDSVLKALGLISLFAVPIVAPTMILASTTAGAGILTTKLLTRLLKLGKK